MPEVFGKALARGAIAIVIVAVAWELAAAVASPLTMPHLGSAFARIFQLVVTADFWTQAGVSAFRIFAGYLLALLGGLPIGLALRQVPELRFALGALFAGLAAVPFVLLAPFTILWLGINSGAQIALAFAAAGFVLISELAAVRAPASLPASGGMPPAAKTDWAPLAPSIVAAARSSFLVAVGAVLASEMLASHAGLGYLLMYATSTFDVATMFAVVIIVALLCALISALLRSIEAQVG
jgi:NitT/TauT family transport system permease protein